MRQKLILVLSIIGFTIIIFVILYSLFHYRSAIEIPSISSLDKSGDLETLAIYLDQRMASIPEGEFIMGSAEYKVDERPCRQVYLDEFKLDQFEVTNVQYKRFIDAADKTPPRYWLNGSFPTGQPDYPVVGVSWADAVAYCKWVGKRLPTEGEWEKACRGPVGRIFPWGDDWDPGMANVGFFEKDQWPSSLDDGWQILQNDEADSGFPTLQPIGSYPEAVSQYGVFDLVGNASEWVADWYNWEGYSNLPLINPIGLGPPWNHSLRGSGWFDRFGQERQVAYLSRCSARNSSHSFDDPRLGFRCAQ